MTASLWTKLVDALSVFAHRAVKKDEREVTEQLLHESLRRLLEVDARTIAIGFMVLSCYLFMQSDYLDRHQIVLSYVLLFTSSLFRRCFVFFYQRQSLNHLSITARIKLYRLVVFVSGLAWGSISLQTFVHGNLVSQSMNAITLAGVVGGACISYSVDKWVMTLFASGALLLGLPEFFAHAHLENGGLGQSAMIGVLIVLFSVFVIMASMNVASFLRDYIKLRIIEKNDKDQIKALLEKQKLHMDYTPLGVVEWLPDGTVISWNVAATKIFGFSTAEMIGQPLSKLFQPDGLTHLNLSIKKLTEQIGGSYLKSNNLTKENKQIFCEWFNTAILDGEGQVINIASMVQDETLFVQAQQEVQRLAYYDALTNLPNRRMLMDRLRQIRANAVRSKTYSGLIFIDLDHFKEVNDVYGHNVGDALLVNISQRLQKIIRKGDTVARMGGDEFVVLLTDMGSDHHKAVSGCSNIAHKIVQVLSEPFESNDFSYPVTASLGICLIHAGMGGAEDILRHADQAMYEAKAAGRNCVRFFEESLEEVLDRKSMLKLALASAVQKNQMTVFLQPQMANHTLIGGEALLRWEHPEFGAVSPEEFIPLAEESGAIVNLGYWVIEKVCAILQTWHQEGGCYISLAVNVSVLQFAQTDFVDKVQHILSRYDFPPHLLKLELTESLMIHHMDEIVGRMLALKALGICLSLDDFGTGYSSLSVLKNLPLDEVKIDRMFVQDILQNSESAAIAETIISMGNKLQLSIIAEGVETQEQVEFLQVLGCHKFQGFLYGRPCSIADFNQFRV